MIKKCGPKLQERVTNSKTIFRHYRKQYRYCYIDIGAHSLHIVRNQLNVIGCVGFFFFFFVFFFVLKVGLPPLFKGTGMCLTSKNTRRVSTRPRMITARVCVAKLSAKIVKRIKLVNNLVVLNI